MPQDSRRVSIARAHVAALRFGWGIEPERLTSALLEGCWPEPPVRPPLATRAWVRSVAEPQPLRGPHCQCDDGVCLICN